MTPSLTARATESHRSSHQRSAPPRAARSPGAIATPRWDVGAGCQARGYSPAPAYRSQAPHSPSGMTGGQAVQPRDPPHPVFEYGDFCRREILREHFAQIDHGQAADEVLDLLAGHRLVPEVLVQAAQDVTPLRVVIDDRADRVEHVPAFGIHVAGALRVDTECWNDRPVIPHSPARADHIGRAGALPEAALGVDPLGVIGE